MLNYLILVQLSESCDRFATFSAEVIAKLIQLELDELGVPDEDSSYRSD
jgi:hypothetical protein